MDARRVPYKGGPPGLADVLGGRVPVMLSGMQGALPYVKSGKVRGLAVTTKKRSPALPESPTVDEALNLRDYEAVNWQGLLFPAGTPRPYAERVAGEVAKILAAADTRSRLETLSYEPSGISPAEMATLMAAERKRWTTVITDIREFREIVAGREEFFRDNLPTSTMVEVSHLADPGLLIEITAIAVLT